MSFTTTLLSLFLLSAVKTPSSKNLKLLRGVQTRLVCRFEICRFTPRWLLEILISIFLLSSRFSLQAQSRDSLTISPETYLQRLQTVSGDTFKSDYEAEFVHLLDTREKRYDESLPLPERRTYIARYWRIRNPDPFAPANGRLEEHLRRCDYARQHFSSDAPPYFDDRGKIYLKYGHPRMRYVDPGIYMQVNPELAIFLPDQAGFINPDSGNVTAVMPQGRRATMRSLLPPGSVIVLENETWCYEHIQPGLVFNFVRHGKRFKLAADLQTAVTGGRLRHRVLQTAVLYLRRQNISSVYFDLAREFEEAGQRLRSFPPELQLKLVDAQIRSAMDHNIRDIKAAIKDAPPEAFIREAGAPKMPFLPDSHNFAAKRNKLVLSSIWA
jgi:GWxTD domain-containing protein